MGSRKINFIAGENYHIYNRGNSKQIIFKTATDYWRFIDLLYAINTNDKFNFSDSLKGKAIYDRVNSNPLVSIGAYCIMPNHFHLLLSPLVEDGISKFMQKLTTGYVMYFNQKNNRSGSLFEGKFKSEYLNSDKYLKYLFSYIHLNPVKLTQPDWKESGIKSKAEVFEYLKNYEYSSFPDYIDIKREQNKILNTRIFKNYFSDKKGLLEELIFWLSYKDSLGKT